MIQAREYGLLWLRSINAQMPFQAIMYRVQLLDMEVWRLKYGNLHFERG